MYLTWHARWYCFACHYKCVQLNDSCFLGCDGVWLCEKLQTFQRIMVSLSLGPRESFWTACRWRWRHCDPFPWKELLAQHTASHHTRSESAGTILHWIGMFANKKIRFCRHYRPDVEAFISCYFCALPFTDIVTVALAQSSMWNMTQNERCMVNWILENGK